jgi:uncharacterized membrane protein
MGASARGWIGALGWSLVAFLSLGIAGHGLSYLVLGGAAAPPVVRDNGAGLGLLRAHAVFAGAALLVGPLQFIAAIRARAPRVHRWTGRFYVTMCLCGGASGLALAPFTAAGPVAGSGFFFLALSWLACTVTGWRAARRGDFTRHKAWMIRSFALTFAAVTLRVYTPLALVAGFTFVESYRLIAWLCWVPNIALAELWLRNRAPAGAS